MTISGKCALIPLKRHFLPYHGLGTHIAGRIKSLSTASRYRNEHGKENET
jgi:hypothetical protein